MVDVDKATAARDEIRTRFGGHPDVKEVGMASDSGGSYVVVITAGQVPQVPLRTANNTRVRQFRQGAIGMPDYRVE